MIMHSMFCGPVEVGVTMSHYRQTNNLVLQAWCWTEEEDGEGYLEPWSTITVNFEKLSKDNECYLDTNNNSEIEYDLIPFYEKEYSDEEIECGEHVLGLKMSGFCCYPKVRLNLEKLLADGKEFFDKHNIKED